MESVQNIIGAIYAEMRVSPLELAVQDIENALTDVLRGMFADLKTSHRDVSLTDEADCNLVLQTDNTYALELQNAQYGEYFEPILLRFLDPRIPNAEFENTTIVPLVSFDEYASNGNLVCSFSGALSGSGRRVRINKNKELIARLLWRVRFVPSAANLLFSDANAPIPSDYLPYLKVKTILKCIRFVNSKSTEWLAWKSENMPLLAAELADWQVKWTRFCDSSDEPEELEFLPFNGFRRR